MSDPLTDKAAAEAFSKQHVHRPNRSQGHAPITDRLHHNGKHWCWASGSYQRWGASRCGLTARTQTADGLWWCHVHEPAAVKKRGEAQEARAQAENKKWADRATAARALAAREAAYPRLVAALVEIARGHNDPRALAREALGDLMPEEEGT